MKPKSTLPIAVAMLASVAAFWVSAAEWSANKRPSIDGVASI